MTPEVAVLTGLVTALVTGSSTVLAALIQRQGRARAREHERVVKLLRCHWHDKTGRVVADIVD